MPKPMMFDRARRRGLFFCCISEVRCGTAKIFWSGQSQAVRLPKEFQFAGDEIRIRRHGEAVILESIATDWAWLDALVGPVDPDFEQAVNEAPLEQQRPELDIFE